MINKIEEKFTLRNGVNYKEMFSGGILIYQCPIINDKKQGVATYYNINQQKIKEIVYDNDKKCKETHFLGDIKHGNETVWGMGSEKTITPYVNGNLHGTIRKFDFFGNLIFIAPCKFGELHGVVEEWHENRVKKNESSYVDGKRCGAHKTWDNKGNLTSKIFYLEDSEIYFNSIPVSYSVFEKSSDKNAREEMLQKLLTARKHGLKNAAKHAARIFHTQRADVLRLTALKFNKHQKEY